MTPQEISAQVLELFRADGKVRLGEHIEAARWHNRYCSAPNPLRMSPSFMRLWCGADGPTKELERCATGVGLEFRHAYDFGGGWDLQTAGAGLWKGLF